MPQRPTAEFGSGVAESMQSVGTTLDLLARAGAVSTATKVKVLHREWDDTSVMGEVALILAETGAGARIRSSTSRCEGVAVAIQSGMVEDLAAGTSDLHAQAEERLLGVIARQLAARLDARGWAERKLAAVQALRTA